MFKLKKQRNAFLVRYNKAKPEKQTKMLVAAGITLKELAQWEHERKVHLGENLYISPNLALWRPTC